MGVLKLGFIGHDYKKKYGDDATYSISVNGAECISNHGFVNTESATTSI